MNNHKFQRSSSMNHKNGLDHHRINNNHPSVLINNCNIENNIECEKREHEHNREMKDLEINKLIMPTIEDIISIEIEPLIEIQNIHCIENKTIIEVITEKEREIYLRALKMWKKPKKQIIV